APPDVKPSMSVPAGAVADCGSAAPARHVKDRQVSPTPSLRMTFTDIATPHKNRWPIVYLVRVASGVAHQLPLNVAARCHRSARSGCRKMHEVVGHGCDLAFRMPRSIVRSLAASPAKKKERAHAKTSPWKNRRHRLGHRPRVHG